MEETTEKKAIKLEQALKTLEEITERMSRNEDDLDEMLKLYEEGIEYMKICRQKLAEAEMKVQILNERMNKEITQD